MTAFDVPATVSIERGAQRLRCAVREWADGFVRCEPLRAGPDALTFLIPRSAVTIAWSTETSLVTVPGTVEGRPDGGIVRIAFNGPASKVQRRDRIRARCAFPCELAIAEEDGARLLPAETIDLSSTGIGLRCSAYADIGTSVAVAVFPPEDSLPVLTGRVVSFVEDTGRLGVAFSSVFPGDLDKVANLVARLLSNRATR